MEVVDQEPDDESEDSEPEEGEEVDELVIAAMRKPYNTWHMPGWRGSVYRTRCGRNGSGMDEREDPKIVEATGPACPRCFPWAADEAKRPRPRR